MADRGSCSSQWGQRCAISVQAPTEALAVRRAKRRMLWTAGMRCPVWKVQPVMSDHSERAAVDSITEAYDLGYRDAFQHMIAMFTDLERVVRGDLFSGLEAARLLERELTRATAPSAPPRPGRR
jgi:hypothetical protein